jgi:ATP-dependent Zn protease
VALDQGFTPVLVSIRPEGETFGRSTHTPAGDPALESERKRENIVAMGGPAAELASGEAVDGVTYDAGDLSWVAGRIDEYASDRFAIEYGWARDRAEQIVAANRDAVERLANELMKRGELTDSAEIVAIIKGAVST